MNDSSDDVEARIRALGEIRVSAGVQDATEALTVMLEYPELRASLESDRRRGFRRLSRRHRLVIGSLIALAGVGVAVPAVAITSLLAHTGKFGDPSTSTEADDTEWIALGAEDAPQVVVDAYPDYLTLPAGMPKEAAIADTSRLFAKMADDAGGQAMAQEGLMTQTYETFGICAWTDAWLTAHASSNKTDEARATSWISDFDNYPEFTSYETGGVRERMTVIATAAADGDVAIMKEAYAENSCDVRLGGDK